MRAALALLALSAATLPGLARAENDPACAKYEEPLAYNACLARHGPNARDISSAPAPSGQRPLDPERAVRAPAPRLAQSAPKVARRHGRIHMEFLVR